MPKNIEQEKKELLKNMKKHIGKTVLHSFRVFSSFDEDKTVDNNTKLNYEGSEFAKSRRD